TRLMAPILSFTAEEVWQVLSKQPQDSVMFQVWHELPEAAGEAELLARWSQLREVRGEVTKAMEEQRIAGVIGSSLQAEVDIHASGEKLALLQALGDDLKFVFICSKTTVIDAAQEQIVVKAAPHQKCERCWHVREDVGAHAEHAALCGRCVSNLHGEGEARCHA
ncbi:MAG TPA: zinc finger domain-containing protein, partial [Rhodocyclaceae bacterium]|nr:zinc finger domain-containing protein [Rhodocyclaceae bacterium]